MIEEISVKDIDAIGENYQIIDIRDEIDFSYGSVADAVNIPLKEIKSAAERFNRDTFYIIMCKSGVVSGAIAQELREMGLRAVNLKEGYYGFMLENLKSDRQKSADIEKSIEKKFRKTLWSKFVAAINKYQLIEEDDKIAVCISGGKDSMLMAKLFQKLKKHNKFPFEIIFLVMDPGYSAENRAIIEKNAKRLNIPITVFESNIFDSVLHIEKSPCYICARMRRGYLYSKAKELGCNKIALGHHYDDVIETILMGMLYGGQVQTMMPKLHSTNFERMELIRPMYFIREDDIKHWRDYNDLHFIQCACKFTDTCTSCHPDNASKRLEIKNLIRELKKTNACVESNIFNSVLNINLDAVIGYKKDGDIHTFLESYSKKKNALLEGLRTGESADGVG